MNFASYIQELRSIPPESPLEPELKQNRLAQDQKIREDQDLKAGAVLLAVVEEGEGTECPHSEDLVYVHVTVRTEEDVVLYSTRGQEGGNGQPLAFIIEKGLRAPRAWEIALKSMHLKQLNALKVKPSYGYEHPECRMPAPKGAVKGQTLCFELQLVQWYPAAQVKALPLADGTYRRILQEGTGWESPRPPFEVTFHCKACCPAYDGIQMTGYRYFSTADSDPVTAQMGSGQLPPGLEACLTSMAQGERSIFVLPASQMKPGPPPEGGQSPLAGPPRPCLLPSPPTAAAQVEVELELLGLVQVRDMTGDGTVVKRRLRQGTGEFPIDCPLEDTTVRIHYRVRPLQLEAGEQLQQASSSSSKAKVWAYDSRQASAQEGAEGGASSSHTDQPPLDFDTGCGEMPAGLEMAIKLMVPGELSGVACQPSHAYGPGEHAPPPGIKPTDAVEFEIELFGFDRDGHWQNLSFPERFAVAERMRAKGNELFRAKKYSFARSRYERLLRMLESTRDYEEQADVERTDALKLAMLSNLALCCYNQADYMQAVVYSSKALEHDPDSAKLLLRRARALSMKGDHELAEEDLVACQALPLEAALAQEVEAELAANKRRAKAAGAKQRQTFKNFFDR